MHFNDNGLFDCSKAILIDSHSRQLSGQGSFCTVLKGNIRLALREVGGSASLNVNLTLSVNKSIFRRRPSMLNIVRKHVTKICLFALSPSLQYALCCPKYEVCFVFLPGTKLKVTSNSRHFYPFLLETGSSEAFLKSFGLGSHSSDS